MASAQFVSNVGSWMQSFMLVAAAVLAGLALAGFVTPWVLLMLIFAVGVGQTLTSPTWQTLQPELVAPKDRTQAIALGAVNHSLITCCACWISASGPSTTAIP